ncbi:hypothetical protein KRX51_03815 [Corynebacterium sp. TAE3-ERU12]|uniref:hypothetical protein n=1 Tax=Corynebacterium sp. TAE3-ERU12 TaxID=2849491 RepID=UPI001C469599|nr:hypothetical protein [Corynebacterium sp. TAE3-ERU12]MBV7295044.1 hypothetical protein [Corynebacterium sp. TAE3-ERU12]
MTTEQPSEPHWGDPSRAQVRQDTGRGERIGATVVLSVAALAALIIEVVYLGTYLTVWGVTVPMPWTVVMAYFMNLIITNTMLLWTTNRTVASIPLYVWVAGFVLVFFWAFLPAGGDVALAGVLRPLALLIAGIAGGGWPLRRQR